MYSTKPETILFGADREILKLRIIILVNCPLEENGKYILKYQ